MWRLLKPILKTFTQENINATNNTLPRENHFLKTSIQEKSKTFIQEKINATNNTLPRENNLKDGVS